MFSFDELLRICQNLLDMLKSFALSIADFITFEFDLFGAKIPLVGILFGSGLIVYLTYKLIRALLPL